MSPLGFSSREIRLILVWTAVAAAGAGVFVIGIDPGLIGMNLSPAIGLVQMGVWMAGLTMVMVGGYGAVRVLRRGQPTGLREDIGLRLAATGYVMAGAATLADLVGIGAQPLPNTSFGPVQKVGLAVGIGICVLGLLLYLPSFRHRRDDTPPL